MIALLNDWGAAWSAWFVPALLQNTVFLALVFLGLHLLRNASAQVRGWVAAVGLLKLALPPFVPVSVGERVAGTASGTGAGGLLFPFSGEASDPGVWSAWTGGLGLPAILLLAWASLVAARLGWVALQTLQLAWSVRGGTPLPPAEIPAEVRRRGVAVHRSASLGVPLTLGPWPRTIHVPADWDAWPADHRRAALRHELAHITRRDGVVQLVELGVQAVWFFHPLVWLLVRHLRTWREMACDDAAVEPDPHARLDYSRFLAELAVRAPVPAMAAGSASTLLRGESELVSRVAHQIREGTMSPVSKRRTAAVLAVLVLAIVPLSLVLAQEAPPPPPPPRSAEPAPVAVPEPAEEPVPAVETEAVAPPAPPKGEMEVPAPPAKGEREVPPPPPKRPHVVLKVSVESILVDGEAVPIKKLTDALRKAATLAGDDPVVVLDADGNVPMGRLHEVQAALKKSELTDVVYKGETGRKLAMALPSEKSMKKLQQLPEDFVLNVAVDGGGVVTVDGKKVPGAKLAKVVAQELKREDKLVVALHTAKDTRYGAMVQVLDSLKKSGATRIAIRDPQ